MQESCNDQLMVTIGEQNSQTRASRPKLKTKMLLWWKTCMLIAAWITMGMSQVLLSTTMPDSRARLGVSVEQMSRALSIASVGALVGAPMGSLADRYHAKVDAIIGGSLLICAFLIAVRCLTTSLIVFTVIIFLDGLTWTCLHSIGNSLLMDLWGDKGGAPMHALHFGYPIGAMVGPLMCYPFVSAAVVDSENCSSTNNATNATIDTALHSNARFKDGSRIEIPYAIVGFIIAAVAVIFLVFQFTIPSKIIKSHQKKDGFKWKDVFSPAKWGGDDSKFGIIIVSLMMTFFALHVSAIKASLVYYTTYAVDIIGYSNREAALYTSVVGFSAMAGRGVSIVCAYFIPIQIMLITEVYGMVLFSVITLLWGLKDKWRFLVFCSLCTFFREPVWPSAYTWTDYYIALYAIVVGLLGVAGKLADIIFSYLLGYLYTYTVVESLFYNTVAAGGLLCVLVVIMNIIAHRHGGRFGVKPPLQNDQDTAL